MTKLRTATVVVMVAGAAAIAAQSPNDERIRRIEAGLLPPVILKGQPLRTSKLDERMRDLKIPGVSVAAFDKGRIEWTRGWGVADATGGHEVEPDTRFQAASISRGSGPGRVELLPESSTTFFAMDSDMRIEFVRDAGGKVTQARVWQGGIERRATRQP